MLMLKCYHELIPQDSECINYYSVLINCISKPYLSPVAASHEDPGAEEELGEPPQLGSAAQLATERQRRRRKERV